MADEKDAFYVVRKGDIVGVYKNYSDFQPLLYGPNVAVFKGYGLPKAAEEFLASHGLKNAIYSIGVSDVQSQQLFGQLVTCPFQQPPSSNDKAGTRSPAENRIKKKVGSTSVSDSPQKKPPEIESFMDTLPVSAYCVSARVFLSLMVQQRETLDQLVLERCCVQLMEVWFTVYVKVWELQQIMLPNTGQSF